MASKPIDSMVRQKFQSFYKIAIGKCDGDFEIFQSDLNKLPTHFAKFKSLYYEGARVDEIVNNHDYPFYTENHSSENWLLEQFANRSFLLGLNEAEEMCDAIYWGRYRWKIMELERALKKMIPPYSFADFQRGKICEYFETFDISHNILEDDYYKIREWQAINLITLVDYEFKIIIQGIQSFCKTVDDPYEFLLKKREKIGELESLPTKGTAIKKFLSELAVCERTNFSSLNDELLEKGFNDYKSGRLTWKGIYPSTIKPLLDKISNATTKPFESEITVFFVINKIEQWMEDVVVNKNIYDKIDSQNWDLLFEQLIKEAEQNAAIATKLITNHAYNENLSKTEIKDFIITELEKYRSKFNLFEKKYLFKISDEKKRNILKRMFITNSYFGNDWQGEYNDIKEAVLIHEVSWELVWLYGDIFETHQVDYPGKNSAHIEIMSVMNQMILDKALYNELRQAMDDFMDHFHSYRLPIEMHFQNQREAMSNLFRKSLNRLEGYLDDAEPTSKVLYLQSRLKQLRHRELNYKQINYEMKDEDEDLYYSGLFKEFLEIEADYLKNTNEIDSQLLLNFLSPTKNLTFLPKIHTQPENFDEIFPGNKGEFVLQLLEDLSITVKGISQLTPKRVDAIRGVVDALLQHQIAPQLNIKTLCVSIAVKTGISVKSGKIDVSKTSNLFLKKANQYILTNYNIIKAK